MITSKEIVCYRDISKRIAGRLNHLIDGKNMSEVQRISEEKEALREMLEKLEMLHNIVWFNEKM